MKNNINFQNTDLTLNDVCRELDKYLDIKLISTKPEVFRYLLAILSSRYKPQFNLLRNINDINFRLSYQNNEIIRYIDKWNHISNIKANPYIFYIETKTIINTLLTI